MLVIRPEQVEVLSQYMLKQFENRMFIHLNKNFPDETQKMSKKELYALIQEGLKQAKQYEVTLENDIRRYLELMVMYGYHLETNPDMARVSEILNIKQLDGTAKMDLIDERELEIVRSSG